MLVNNPIAGAWGYSQIGSQSEVDGRAMNDKLVTLIGGGGFVGRYVAQALLAHLPRQIVCSHMTSDFRRYSRRNPPVFNPYLVTRP